MMKINKRKCRAYAVPDRKLSSANGILHAKQINYIVTAAVKTIAHHRTLVLYIYPREQAVRGDYKPLWYEFGIFRAAGIFDNCHDASSQILQTFSR